MYVFHFLLCSLPSFIHWLILVTTKNTIFFVYFQGTFNFHHACVNEQQGKGKKPIFIGLKIDNVKLSKEFCV